MSRRDGGGRGPPDTEGMISLKVDNLTYNTTSESLKRVFDRYGEVGDVYIPRDPYTQESRGFGFVRFYDQKDADDALDAMDGQMLDGRPLRVEIAARRAPQSQSGFRGRGGRGGSPPRRRRSRSRSRGRGGRRSSSSPSRSRSADDRRGGRSRRSRSDDRKDHRGSKGDGESKGRGGSRDRGEGNGRKSGSRSRSPDN